MNLAAPKYIALAALLAVVTFEHSMAAESVIADNPPVPALPLPTESVRPIRVGMVDSGVNYLLPLIQQSLARDSSGQLIGYDYWDLDERPFDSHPTKSGLIQRHGTQTASLLLMEAPFVSLVPYRYPRPAMQRMEQLLEHAAKHDVRIVGLPLGGNLREDWLQFEIAAKQHPQILFIASAGNNGRDIDQEPVFPAALSLSNLLVVTSADDFVQPATGVNWGRTSVDYMVPAEMQTVVRFDGSEALVSGSSYAVPRVVALAARLLRQHPDLETQGLLAKIRSKFANGAVPRKIGQGYLYDPQFNEEGALRKGPVVAWQNQLEDKKSSAALDSELLTLTLTLDVHVLDERWTANSVADVLTEANDILGQCGIAFNPISINYLHVEDYLRDLETGRSKTLMELIGRGGPNRNPTVFFARDTRMNQPFDAEAFGQGNTRSRPWLTDSVWLTLALRDRGIALAHELFHILLNSGQHTTLAANLMLARTTGNNRKLTHTQCDELRLRVAAR